MFSFNLVLRDESENVFFSIPCFETRSRNRKWFLMVEREKIKLHLTRIPGSRILLNSAIHLLCLSNGRSNSLVRTKYHAFRHIPEHMKYFSVALKNICLVQKGKCLKGFWRKRNTSSTAVCHETILQKSAYAVVAACFLDFDQKHKIYPTDIFTPLIYVVWCWQ